MSHLKPSEKESALGDDRPDRLPVWVQVLLERLVPYGRRDAVTGDFAETWQWIRKDESRSRAFQWILWQLMKSMPSFFSNGLTLGSSMIANYLKSARRNILKRKFYAGLNIGGLVIGMAICLLILQYVAFETSYDSFHTDRDRLYRANMISYQAGERTGFDAFTSWAMGPLFSDKVPGVEGMTRYHPSYGVATIRTVGESPEAFRTRDLGFADPAFFSMFTYHTLAGDPEEALSTHFGAVITRSAAMRYFGTDQVLGRDLDIYAWMNGTFTIRAVIEDMPANSHLHAEIILPLSDLIQDPDGQYAETDGWGWTNFVTYVKLRPDADKQAVAGVMSDVIEAADPEDWEESETRKEMTLQPVEDIHLLSEFSDGYATASAYKTVLFLSIIGLFVLVIAWLNYVNLSTARAMERAREVGIRKASGARRMQIVMQFLVESMVVNGIALLVAVLLASRLLPVLNRLVGLSIPATIWKSPTVWGSLLLLFGLGSVFASFYPAVVVSSFQPARVLKGLLGSGTRSGRPSRAGLKRSLVVFQFAISIALLSGTYIVSRQVNHLQGVDLGMQLDQVLVVQRPAVVADESSFPEARTAFLEELENMSAVSNVARSTAVPGRGFNLGTSARKESDDPADTESINAFWLGDGFLDTYGIPVIAGRALSGEFESDLEDGVVLNRTAVETFGLGSPEDAIGARLVVGSSSVVRVVGVTEDFQWMSAKKASPPVFMLLTEGGGNFSMQVASNDVTRTVDQVRETYQHFFPGNTFEYAFANAEFDAMYRAEERLGTLVRVFALFALVVAMLGLIGLAALTSAQRTREIGIRKALGADSWSIARLLSGQFVVLVALGLVLAVPVTWVVAQRWLGGFAERISLTPDLFLLPGIAVLAAALGASLYHVVRAARMNPVTGIRSE